MGQPAKVEGRFAVYWKGLRERPWWVVAILTSVAAAIGALLTLWDGPLPVSKAGSLDGWIAGGGSILAVCVALWAVAEGKSDREKERREDTQLARRAEAESVIAVFDLDANHAAIRVFNFGDRPIRNIEISARPLDRKSAELRSEKGFPIDFRCPYLAPGGTFANPQATFVPSKQVDIELSSIAVAFVDIYGQRWKRIGPGAGTLSMI